MAGTAVAAVPAIIAIAALLGFEAWLGVRWLGSRFEELDVSSELRP
jgi:hypothetical protein